MTAPWLLDVARVVWLLALLLAPHVYILARLSPTPDRPKENRP